MDPELKQNFVKANNNAKAAKNPNDNIANNLRHFDIHNDQNISNNLRTPVKPNIQICNLNPNNLKRPGPWVHNRQNNYYQTPYHYNKNPSLKRRYPVISITQDIVRESL